MPTRNQLDQAVRISLAIDPPFPLDIIVRTPHTMRWPLAEGDSFVAKSRREERSCMQRLTAEWVRKAEADFLAANKLLRKRSPA